MSAAKIKKFHSLLHKVGRAQLTAVVCVRLTHSLQRESIITVIALITSVSIYIAFLSIYESLLIPPPCGYAAGYQFQSKKKPYVSINGKLVDLFANSNVNKDVHRS